MFGLGVAAPTTQSPLIAPSQKARCCADAVGLEGLAIKAPAVVLRAKQARVHSYATGAGNIWLGQAKVGFQQGEEAQPADHGLVKAVRRGWPLPSVQIQAEGDVHFEIDSPQINRKTTFIASRF